MSCITPKVILQYYPISDVYDSVHVKHQNNWMLINDCLLFLCSRVKSAKCQPSQAKWCYHPRVCFTTAASSQSNLEWIRWWNTSSGQETSSWLQPWRTSDISWSSLSTSHSLLENWRQTNDSFTWLCQGPRFVCCLSTYNMWLCSWWDVWTHLSDVSCQEELKWL